MKIHECFAFFYIKVNGCRYNIFKNSAFLFHAPHWPWYSFTVNKILVCVYYTKTTHFTVWQLISLQVSQIYTFVPQKNVFNRNRKSQKSLYLFTYSYLLTPWCWVLEKLTGLQLVKKFPAFDGTRRFITALTSVRHLSLSWASPIQSTHPHSTSWRSILILSTHLRLGLPSCIFPSGFPIKTLYTPLSSPIRASFLAHLILLNFITFIFTFSNFTCDRSF